MNTYLVQVYGNTGSAVEILAKSFERAAKKYVEDETAWIDQDALTSLLARQYAS